MGKLFEGPGIVVLILVVLVLFGSKRLPDVARGVGRSLRIFKAETKGLITDDEGQSASAAAPAQIVAPPAVPPPPVVTPPAAPVAQPVVQPAQPADVTAPPTPAHEAEKTES